MRQSLRTTALLLLMASAPALAQTASWKSVAPANFNGLVGGIDFPSRDTGYAVSSSSDIGATTGGILMSVDRGEHWTIKNFDGVGLYDIRFADARKGYAVGYNAGCGCGVIYSTSDAGANWTSETYSGTTLLKSIFFIDKSTGFAAGDKAMLLKTTNGGTSWNPVATGEGSDIDFGKIFFATPSIGYMIGAVHSRGWNNLIFKTTDGGAHWTRIVDNGEDTDTKPTYASLFFTSADTGFVTGREGAFKTIYRTTNGGTNWEKVSSLAAAGDIFSMGGITFINANIGYASGDEGTIVRTTNGGQTWKRETSGVNTALPAIEFIDENTGFVGGLFGSFIKRSIPLVPTAMVDPAELDFGDVSGVETMTVKIDAANELGVRIDSIYIQNLPGKTSGFALDSPKGPFPIMVQQGTPRTITVSYTPVAGFNGDAQADLTLKTNDPANGFLTITLRAHQTSTANPSAQLSATSLDFGKVVAGETKDLSVTLGAANAAGLRIDSIKLVDHGSPGLFELIEPLDPTPIDIAMGSPLTFTVRYEPSTAGTNASASLEIRTNDPTNSTLTVALMGEAITAPAGVTAATEAARRLKVRALPNPVEHDAQLTVNVPRAGEVNVALYDLYGYRVADLFNATSSAGELTLPLDAGRFANGIYYCIVRAGGENAYCEITIER